MTQLLKKKKESSTQELDLPYVSLAPRTDEKVDEKNIYSNAIKHALEDETVYNIAISGIYGAGKSSVIGKFIKTYKNQYEFFHISLATFFEKEKAEDYDVNSIEKSILKQIFY